MTLYQLAQQVPAKFRNQILEENLIYKAIPQPEDTHMKMLFIIWQNYIEPGNEMLDMACNKCLYEMLNKYKLLQPHFITLTKEDKLLDL